MKTNNSSTTTAKKINEHNWIPSVLKPNGWGGFVVKEYICGEYICGDDDCLDENGDWVVWNRYPTQEEYEAQKENK